MREGAIIYHGALADLPGYLRGLGYLPPGLHTHHGSGVERETSLGAGDGEGSSPQPQTGTGQQGEDACDEDEGDLADWVTEWATFPARRLAKDMRRRTHGAALGGTAAAAGGDGKPAPTTTAELVAAWVAHPLYAAMLVSADSTDGRAASLELSTDAARAQYGRPYAHSAWKHLWLLLKRQITLNRRNKLFVGV